MSGEQIINYQHIKEFSRLLDESYYERAIEFIRKSVNRPVFFVFSDEIKMVKEMGCFQKSNVTFIEDDRINEDYIEFALMRKCKHNIVANSTSVGGLPGLIRIVKRWS